MTIPSSLTSTSTSTSSQSVRKQPQHQQVSYFRDPHINAVRQTPPSTYYAPRTPAPLVLDPQRALPANGEMSPDVIQKLFPASVKHHQSPHQHFLTPTSDTSLMDQIDSPEQDETAATFARSAPKAGFLMKLGTNIPEFKRRFFVLKPSTHLYYFLSPNDTEPRGCMDLDGAQIHPVTTLPDGRVRFAIEWPPENTNNKKNKRVILEARSQDMGKEWMESLQRETMASHKIHLKMSRQKISEQEATIAKLLKEVESFRMVEKDRDGAMEDAKNWKHRFDQLNEAVRRLTISVRRPPEIEENTNLPKHINEMAEANRTEANEIVSGKSTKLAATCDSSLEETQRTGRVGEDLASEIDRESSVEVVETTDTDETPKTANIKHGPEAKEVDESTLSRCSTLADVSAEDDELSLDKMDVRDTHFPSLRNACRQLREIVRLASVEASTALQDLNEANANSEALQQRMTRAEKHLCKLWEENTSIRQELNVVKKEKRVLVKEVKTLRSKTAAPGILQDRLVDEGVPSCSQLVIDEQGEHLIEDLEEHVESSLRLHKQFMVENKQITDLVKNTFRLETATGPQSWKDSNSALEVISVETSERSSRASPIQPKILSLFDEDLESTDESQGESDEDAESVLTSCVSSVVAEMGDFDASSVDTSNGNSANPAAHEGRNEQQVSHFIDKSDRRHPLQKLDEENEDDEGMPDSGAAEPETTKSVITDNGHATTRLECPFADVVETHKGENGDSKDDGQVYHLTFYSQKIGIQFQKVPPPPSRSALAEAMTVDLRGEDSTDSQKTAGELRRIAELSHNAKNHDIRLQEANCDVAPPVDAVLVCGFRGFDDSAKNKRPKLGARLVAFDGISIEFGKWTFESIRKAIQARNRPLTLSFRNDFLTTRQREILTKAVDEVESNLHPSQRLSHHRPPNVTPRRGSNPGSRSSASHESERFVNDTLSADDGMNDSVASNSLYSVSSSNYTPCGVSFSASNSVMSGNNYRSFSEAGSSVVSSAVGPLMAKLMNGIQSERESASYAYLSRNGASVETMANHIDFQSGLL